MLLAPRAPMLELLRLNRLQKLVDFSHLGVLLYDQKHNVMRFHLLETCEPTEPQTPLEVPMEGSIAG